MKVKVGEKGRHMEVPEGWCRVSDFDACKPGDMFANVLTLVWESVDAEDVECGVRGCDFDALIRRVG